MDTARSISVAARELGVPESTLRSWRNKFKPYVIVRVDEESGKKVYDMQRLKELKYVCGDWAKTPPRRNLRDVGFELARLYPEDAKKAGIKPPPSADVTHLGDDGQPLAPTYVTVAGVLGPEPTPAALAALATLPEALSEANETFRQADVDLLAIKEELGTLRLAVVEAKGELGELRAAAGRRGGELDELKAAVGSLQQVMTEQFAPLLRAMLAREEDHWWLIRALLTFSWIGALTERW